MTTGSDPRTLRVATLNLWCRGGDWPDRRSVLTEGFRDLSADLVALQEVMLDDGGDQAAEILGDDYRVVHQQKRDSTGMGVSIASRWPVRRIEEVDLHVTPRTGDFPCVALIAKVAAPDPIGDVVFVNHFPSFQLDLEYERELQAVAAVRSIAEIAGDRETHVVVAGDLDADPEAGSIRFWTGRQSLTGMSVCYRDAWASAHRDAAGDTFTPDNPLQADWDWPFRRIDYILVRCGPHGGPTLAVQSCRRIFDTPVNGVWASDHFGVAADLAPPPARATCPDASGPERNLPSLDDLDSVVDLVTSRSDLYLRYSHGPDSDLGAVSRDYEAGVALPGLSVTPIAPEPWWPRPAKDWVARRICKYEELGEEDGRFPWLLSGRLVANGPDHEPIVRMDEPVAALTPRALDEARQWYRRRFDIGQDSTTEDADDVRAAGRGARDRG